MTKAAMNNNVSCEQNGVGGVQQGDVRNSSRGGYACVFVTLTLVLFHRHAESHVPVRVAGYIVYKFIILSIYMGIQLFHS